MRRYAFKMNSAKCIGCRTCVMACKNFNQLLPEIQWRKVYPLDEKIYPLRDRAFYSLACNHCDNPACRQACPTASYRRRDDGIIVHNKDTCLGCTNCIRACPYGAPQYNHAEKHVEKCSMCVDRIDAGLNPICVDACPVSALELVDLTKHTDLDFVLYPPGFPRVPLLRPGTRFIVPKLPSKIVRD